LEGNINLSTKDKRNLYNNQKSIIREEAKMSGDLQAICKHKRAFYTRTDAKNSLNDLMQSVDCVFISVLCVIFGTHYLKESKS